MVASLQGSVYKIGIVEATSKYLWLFMSDSKKVNEMLDSWLKTNIPMFLATHGMVTFKF